jgi:hypothetical protein
VRGAPCTECGSMTGPTRTPWCWGSIPSVVSFGGGETEGGDQSAAFAVWPTVGGGLAIPPCDLIHVVQKGRPIHRKQRAILRPACKHDRLGSIRQWECGSDNGWWVSGYSEHLNIVFIGHVDAGKSTIGGQILFLTGAVDDRTIQKYEREAKEKNRESWCVSRCSPPPSTQKGDVASSGFLRLAPRRAG